MTDHDRPRLAAALAVLAETFNEPFSKLRAEGYFDALRDLQIGDVERSIRTALRTQTFFPKPAELRALVAGTFTEHAVLAWADLLREVRRVGYTGRPELSEPTRVAVERLCGSWVTLCETLPAEGAGLRVWENRFREIYQALATQDRLSLPDRAPLAIEQP